MSRILAIDIDQATAFVAGGQARGGVVRLEQAAAIPLGEVLTPSVASELGKKVRDALKAQGIAPGPVVAIVGRDRVILKDVKIPNVPASEEANIVRFQASKDMTEAADSVVLDYYTLSRPDADGQTRVVTASIRKDLLASYRALCQSAGLKLVGVSARPLGTLGALERAIASGAVTAPEAKHASVAVLTRGEKWGELIVARDGQVVFSRTLSATALNSEPMLLGELRRNLAVYNGQNPQQPVETLYVAEASGPAGTWSGRIRAGLTIPVQEFDPLAGLESDTPPESRGYFAGLAGAMQLASGSKPLPINFAAPREPVDQSAKRKKVLAGLAAVVALLVIGGLGYGYLSLNKKQSQLTTLIREKNDLDKRIKELEEDEKRIKIFREWDDSRVNWLDEMYDLAARFPDINGARVEQFRAEPLAVQKNAKTKYVARMFLKMQTESGKLMDDFQVALQADRKYHNVVRQTKGGATAGAGRFTQSYELRADIEKRTPTEYTRNLIATVPSKPSRAMKFPDGTGGGFPEFGGGRKSKEKSDDQSAGGSDE